MIDLAKESPVEETRKGRRIRQRPPSKKEETKERGVKGKGTVKGDEQGEQPGRSQ